MFLAFLFIYFENIKSLRIFAINIYGSLLLDHFLSKPNTSMRKVKVILDQEKLLISSEILRALAHPLRLKILEFIDNNDSINVNKIYNTLKLEQSITSQHLRILRINGLVITKRDGKYIHYSVNYDGIKNAVDSVNNFLALTESEKNSVN